MVDVYRHVPRELFSNRLPPRGPRLIHLQHAATAQAVFTSRAATIGAPAEAVQAPLLQATLDCELSAGCQIAESATWTQLLSDMRVLIPWVPLFRPRMTVSTAGASPAASGDSQPSWDVAAERFLAIPIALMLRELASRIVRGVYTIFAALVLLLAYQVSFPAYPRRAMVAITWVYVLVGVCTAIATVVSFERDAVMSRLAGTSAGKIEWDAAFLQRTLIPLLFALLTVFAVQFPGAGGTLLQWLRPMQTALPLYPSGPAEAGPYVRQRHPVCRGGRLQPAHISRREVHVDAATHDAHVAAALPVQRDTCPHQRLPAHPLNVVQGHLRNHRDTGRRVELLGLMTRGDGADVNLKRRSIHGIRRDLFRLLR
jgi:hypothetical protein